MQSELEPQMNIPFLNVLPVLRMVRPKFQQTFKVTHTIFKIG